MSLFYNIDFDDDRAKATLKVLADISYKTQIIFFTHHLHVLDLASKAFSAEQALHIHYL